MCNSGVPNGQVILGLDVWDKAGNAAYSPGGVRNITKNYNCGSSEVRLYDNTNYGGPYVYTTSPGLYTLVSNFNDMGESISMPSGWSVRLFEHDNYTGPEVCIQGNDSNLSDNYYSSSGNSAANSATWMEVYSQSSCPPITTLPSAPTLSSPDNNAVFERTSNITLTWNSANGATEYYAEFWGGPNLNLNSGWTTNLSWYLGSQWGGIYQWRVKSRNTAGESGWSETRTLTIKYGSPTNLSGTAVSTSQINLSWSASADAPGNIDGYRIFRNSVAIATVASSVTAYSDTGLNIGTTYSYYVKAYKGTLESNPSNTINVSTGNTSYEIYLPVISTYKPEWDTIFYDGFEGAFPGNWTIYDLANDGAGIGYQWRDRGCLSTVGSWSGWAVGGGINGGELNCGSNYPNNANTWMVYGPFSLSNASSAELLFDLWLNSEVGYDFVSWGVSENGWLFSMVGEDGNTYGWTPRSLDFANLDGTNYLGKPEVWIAFRFTSDGSVTYPYGAVIDEVLVRKCVGGICQ